MTCKHLDYKLEVKGIEEDVDRMDCDLRRNKNGETVRKCQWNGLKRRIGRGLMN